MGKSVKNPSQISLISSVLLFELVAILMHVGFLMLKGYDPLANKLLLSYACNTGLAMILLAFLLNLPEKLKNNIGYIFLGGSVFKLLLYFLVFAPIYKADGDQSLLEFLSFFVPYFTGLIAETKVLITKLNQED